MRAGRSLMVSAALAVGLWSAPLWAADRDPRELLKEADRRSRLSDTAGIYRILRSTILDPASPEWAVEEAVKFSAGRLTAPSDSPQMFDLFSLSLRHPGSASILPTVLALIQEYAGLTSEEKLAVLSELKFEGKAAQDLLEAQIHQLRRVGRLDAALELAARLAQQSGRLDHRGQVVDLLLDLSRPDDALALSLTILSDHLTDPAAYSQLSDRFYRHGDYRKALLIHRRARVAFSNPMIFFDQSLSICQGLQLGREGIELYLPVLQDGAQPAPELFRDFLSFVTDTAYFVTVYPAQILSSQNPHLYLAALFRYAETVPDTACLAFIRSYSGKFQNASAHIGLAEHLLDRGRFTAFRMVLDNLADTPPDVFETKQYLLFQYHLREEGVDAALKKYSPATFTQSPLRAAVHRRAAQGYLSQSRFGDALESLKAARELAPQQTDPLDICRLHFMMGSDKAALAAAYDAHRSNPSDETLYWLGWLSFLQSDTETARKAFRDVALHSEGWNADEALAWLAVLLGKSKADPESIGRAVRDAMVRKIESSESAELPESVRLIIRRDAIRSGADVKKMSETESILLRYLRWAALPPPARSDAVYQKLLRDAPEDLRALIRTEAP